MTGLGHRKITENVLLDHDIVEVLDRRAQELGVLLLLLAEVFDLFGELEL